MDFATEKREFIEKLKESFFTIPELEKRQEYIDFIRLQVPEPTASFNSYGLRYHTDFLAKMGYNLLAYPVFIQADFADQICVNLVKDNAVSVEIVQPLVYTDYTQLNATAIGNMAYTSLNCKDFNVQNVTKKLLLEFVTNFYEMHLTPELLQLAKNPLKTGTKLN